MPERIELTDWGTQSKSERTLKSGYTKKLLKHVLVLKQPPVLFGIAIIIFWEFLCRILAVPTYLLPTPSIIAQAAYKYLEIVSSNTLYTFWEVLAGFIVGSILSIVCAILITYYAWFRKVFLPYIVLFNNLPKLALAPIFIVWFGFSFLTNVGIVVALGAFPVLINFIAGLEGIKEEEIRLMQSYNATKWQTFYHVRLFNAMPFLFAGLKLSMVLSVAGAVVAEFVTGHAGLAYLMLLSSTNLQIPLMFVCLLTLGILGLVLYIAVSIMEKVLTPWTKGKAQTVTEGTI